MTEPEQTVLPARISLREWLRALVFSPGVLFLVLYVLAMMLCRSPLSWLLDWASQ